MNISIIKNKQLNIPSIKIIYVYIMYNFNTRYIQLFVFNNIYTHCFNYDIFLDILTTPPPPHDHTQTDIPRNLIIYLIYNLTLIT